MTHAGHRPSPGEYQHPGYVAPLTVGAGVAPLTVGPILDGIDAPPLQLQTLVIKTEPATTITVYGQSDDNIYVKGDWEEQFNGGDEPRWLAFSDGTVLRVTYGVGDTGTWEIRVEAQGSAFQSHRAWTDEEQDYSDEVTLSGDLRWVAVGQEFGRIRKS